MKKETNRTRLTAARVETFTCPPGKSQAFLWDTDAPALLLRVTPTGRKTYAFEGRLNGGTIRISIGTAADWPLAKARARAAELKQQVDRGEDPRELQRQQQAEREAKAQAEAVERLARALTAAEAWQDYAEARRPYWGERHHQDHLKLAQAGGKISKRGTRGKGVTMAGPLHSLLALPLAELNTAAVEAWAKAQAKDRPTAARLALRCLKAFLNWCTEQPQYAALISGTNPAKAKKAREVLGKAGVKNDALLREQLPAWFAAVRQIQNPAVSAYLQTILLTGARPGEVLGLRWDDLGTQWRSLTIRDKVEGERMIPLTPYVHHLLANLPRRNEYVFATTRRTDGRYVGTLTQPRKPHDQACAVAGIGALTLHGLRRSFKSLTEWLEIPAGVVAQIMGHKPSATAEKHYTVRPLDLLRVHHERIEAWMLEQAGVTFNSASEPGKLRAVA